MGRSVLNKSTLIQEGNVLQIPGKMMGKLWTKENKDKFSYKINITVDKVKEKQKVEIQDEYLEEILLQEVVGIEWINYYPLKSSFFGLYHSFVNLNVTVLMYVQFLYYETHLEKPELNQIFEITFHTFFMYLECS